MNGREVEASAEVAEAGLGQAKPEPVSAVLMDGTVLYLLAGVLHREDGPALVRADGTREWYRNGFLHREGGPAVIYPGGRQEWFLMGEKRPPPAQDVEFREIRSAGRASTSGKAGWQGLLALVSGWLKPLRGPKAA